MSCYVYDFIMFAIIAGGINGVWFPYDIEAVTIHKS